MTKWVDPVKIPVDKYIEILTFLDSVELFTPFDESEYINRIYTLASSYLVPKENSNNAKDD